MTTYIIKTRTDRLDRYAADRKTWTHLFLTPTKAYRVPVIISTTPAIARAGVIRGWSGSTVGGGTSVSVAFRLELVLDGVGVDVEIVVRSVAATAGCVEFAAAKVMLGGASPLDDLALGVVTTGVDEVTVLVSGIDAAAVSD